MARPTTKVALLEQANTAYDKLQELIGSMGPVVTRPFAEEVLGKGKEAHWARDHNVRDVIIHVYEWQTMLLRWLASNRGTTSGAGVPFLPQPYNWKTYGELNAVLWEKHQQTPLEAALNLLAESHLQTIAAIDSFSDEELFTKSFFSWSGTTSVGSYCVSATASHYEWALKKLRLHVKTSA